MKRKTLVCTLIVLFGAQWACNLLTPNPPTSLPPTPALTVTSGAPVETPPPTATAPAAQTPAGGALTVELLKNFTYRLDDFNAEVTLQDGVYDGAELHTQFIEPAAFGDLNGDGVSDAAVILATNSGGSGTFFDLIAVLDQNGTPQQTGYTSIGDRQGINDLTITGDRIVLDYLTQSRSDPLCCPSERRLRSYLLVDGALRLASEQILPDDPTAAATPLPNAILIDRPNQADPLSNPLVVRGRVSQAPPEMTLAYYITDLSATLLAQGEAPLQGEPGGPATFDFEIDLDGVAPGLYLLELVDTANGILRGRSVVELIGP